MEKIRNELIQVLGKERVLSDELSLTATAADAGCYQKNPQIVLKPAEEQEVISSLRILHNSGIPLTFRAAGTSLSGQSVSDSVLMVARDDDWKQYEILDGGKRIKAGPGITGTRLNQVLARTGMKFGPDPASINSAMLGGIIANNASGMSCGVHANSYATIESARIILADGYLIDTAKPGAGEKLAKEKPELTATLERIRDEIRNNQELGEKIRRKYSIKNTTGYSMNSFLDFDEAADILLHLLVGSEGTLGFVSEATFKTVPVLAARASSLIYFKDLKSACEAVPGLREAGVPAIEIMDREALRAVEGNPGIPDYLKAFDKNVTSLLIDLEAENETKMAELIEKTRKVLDLFPLVRDFELTSDPKEIAEIWTVRKGVFPSVGGMRKPGTSVIIEDIAVRAEHLTDAVGDLRLMLDELGYADAVIYGHVLDGNLHFIFSQDFHQEAELKKYEKMISRLTRLIVEKYDGSLKAEHGTGINMAPFVEFEWGKEIYAFMKDIKTAFDPLNILNPGVLINDDPKAHLKDFKPMPVIDEAVDACIECGFCEISCLTNGLSLSARQRIVVQREMERLIQSGENPEKWKKLEKAFKYQGDASCAGDGLCATSCPLSIDTGIMIKHLRARNNARKRPGNPIARKISHNFRLIHAGLRTGLGFMHVFHKIIPIRKIWVWHDFMPRPSGKKASKKASGSAREKTVVYFPSCINQSMGTAVKSKDKRSLIEVSIEVMEKAGYRVLFPDGMDRLCCGTPWESKGFFDIADAKSTELETALWKISEEGKYPILCDTSPCTHRMRRVMSDKLKLYEPVEFIHDFLLNELELEKSPEPMAFHVTCTSTKMGLEEQFRKVAQACTEHPVFPEEVGCCGFAGDKGFFQPEINTWALRNLKLQVDRVSAGYSNSRTCEIGLARNSGIDYKSVMYMVRDAIKED